MKTNGYELIDFPKTRLATIDLGRLGLTKHYMFGLLEIDVTAARSNARTLRKAGQGISFTAWMVKAVSNSVVRNKQAHALLAGKRSLVIFEDVDVAIPVERVVGTAGVPLPLLIKSTNRKSIQGIQGELDAAAHQNISDERNFILSQHDFSKATLKLYYALPQWVRLLAFRWIFNNPYRAKKNSGTVLLTTVNAAGRSAGWILPTRTLHNLSIALGSITKKPWVVGGEVKVRDILHVTITFNHDVIDGVPARKFVQDLTRQLESGCLYE
ncbi:MAG TPA: 2-oxo acid dehydrogenase subunit E2 [Anaerolineales bacterium]|nr:2-oxo acid dehydrogenase subunit E2 [Anaerolineales bacterium]